MTAADRKLILLALSRALDYTYALIGEVEDNAHPEERGRLRALRREAARLEALRTRVHAKEV